MDGDPSRCAAPATWLAKQTLEAIIEWGRYAEIFSCDDHTERFSLER